MVNKVRHWIFVFIFAFGVNFIAKVAVDPDFTSMSTDGGAFAYCGQQIVGGALLYRDCWDNKPPAIYYLNAAAIALGGHTQWSIWLFETIWISITAVVFFSILSKVWTSGVAWICTSLMLLTVLYPAYFMGGNLTETYALLPITLAIGAFWGYLKTNRNIYLPGIGLCAAGAFLFKPTYLSIGIGATLVLAYLSLRQKKYLQLLRQLILILSGFLAPLLIVAAYWIAQHDLNDLLYAVFIHNRLYIQEGFSWRSFIITLRIFILEQPLAALFALDIITLIFFIATSWKVLWKFTANTAVESNHEYTQVWFLVGLTITIFLDMVFIALPGKNYKHYYQIPIPSMAVLSAYLVYHLSRMKSVLHKNNVYPIIMVSALSLILLPWLVEVVGKEFPSRAYWAALFSNPNITQYQPDDLEKFILENTNSDQSILIWDYDPSIYFDVDRRSPTRFIFLRHLYTPIPGAVNGFAEFMQELQDDPPELIISSKSSQHGLPYLGYDENRICSDCSPDIREGVVAFKRFVSQYYQAYMDIQTWAIYKRLK